MTGANTPLFDTNAATRRDAARFEKALETKRNQTEEITSDEIDLVIESFSPDDAIMNKFADGEIVNVGRSAKLSRAIKRHAEDTRVAVKEALENTKDKIAYINSIPVKKEFFAALQNDIKLTAGGVSYKTELTLAELRKKLSESIAKFETTMILDKFKNGKKALVSSIHPTTSYACAVAAVGLVAGIIATGQNTKTFDSYRTIQFSAAMQKTGPHSKILDISNIQGMSAATQINDTESQISVFLEENDNIFTAPAVEMVPYNSTMIPGMTEFKKPSDEFKELAINALYNDMPENFRNREAAKDHYEHVETLYEACHARSVQCFVRTGGLKLDPVSGTFTMEFNDPDTYEPQFAIETRKRPLEIKQFIGENTVDTAPKLN